MVKPSLDELRSDLGLVRQGRQQKYNKPFNEFDIQDRIEDGYSAESIWNEIKQKGLYLSSEGPCYVSEDDGWSQYESFKAFGDRNKQKKTAVNLSAEKVFNQFKDDFESIKKERAT